MGRFTVSRLPGSMVSPAEPTPTGTLPLSWLDRLPTHKTLQDTIHVFRRGVEPAKTIRRALSRALVNYYPFAGVLVLSGDGELVVELNGEGAWFVEASADCTLEDVRCFEYPYMIPAEELLPPPPTSVADPTDMMIFFQVTEFKCGGFVIGLRANHAIADGMGAGQFIKAVADIAKGLPHPSVSPVWCRDSLPVPKMKPRLAGPPPPPPPPQLLTVLDVPNSYLDCIKEEFLKLTGGRCSAFDVLAAKAWQSRTRARLSGGIVDPAAKVHLVIPMSMRHLLRNVIPGGGEGYYGNCIYLVCASAPSSEVADGSLLHLVKLVRDAKASLPESYFRSLGSGNGDADDEDDDDDRATPPQNSFPLNEGTMFVIDWSRLELYDADYGWGSPVNVSPAIYPPEHILCIILKPPEPKQGRRLWAHCFSDEELLRSFVGGISSPGSGEDELQGLPAPKLDVVLGPSPAN